MRRRVRHNLLSILTLSLFAAPAALAAEPPGGLEAAEGRIDAADAKAHIAWLADDAREGRGAGTAGGRAAGEYIAKRCAALGLKPGGGGTGDEAWFQPFTVEATKCRNVVAYREGRDPKLKDEHVVIGAH